MKRKILASALLGGLLLMPMSAQAHCDTVDGPVATTALSALESDNVNAVLPYVPAAAESEVIAAFEEARRVRAKDVEARHLADRYFQETVVRLHRQGEGAPYTGLKPAGQDFGPVIPAAEQALEHGNAEALVEMLAGAVERQVSERLRQSLAASVLPREPASREEVAAARERVEAELGFVLYAEALHQAIKGHAAHAEGGHVD
ncbi:DUF6448 family protein [Roseibium sp.]|uniref:DUF6448 family protein n=1 Tax=Roseibium sp. TaxID=1936156 RepID=UPI003D13DE77